jgi:uncharacterized membrane protein YwzB
MIYVFEKYVKHKESTQINLCAFFVFEKYVKHKESTQVDLFDILEVLDFFFLLTKRVIHELPSVRAVYHFMCLLYHQA